MVVPRGEVVTDFAASAELGGGDPRISQFLGCPDSVVFIPSRWVIGYQSPAFAQRNSYRGKQSFDCHA